MGLEGLIRAPRRERRQARQAGKHLSGCEPQLKRWFGGGDGCGELGEPLGSAESFVAVQMPQVRKQNFIDEIMRFSHEKSARQYRLFFLPPGKCLLFEVCSQNVYPASLSGFS